jgi:hypothetical protein
MNALIYTRVNNNYAELLKSGIDSTKAKVIAAKLRMRVILDVLIADTGIILHYWEGGIEKKTIIAH